MTRIAPWILLAALALHTTPDPARAEGPRYYPRVVALCIGIENYQHVIVPPAPAAESDARELGRFLEERYGFTPDYLIGREATKEAILDRLARYGRELRPEDVLLVFFAGHGQVIEVGGAERAGFLLPHDANLDLLKPGDPADWREHAIEMRPLAEDLRKHRAGHVLMMVDACCSGFMARRGNLEFRHDLTKLLTEPSRVVLAATTESEAALARQAPGRRRGIFTDALLKALDTREAKSVTDVFVEVRADVVNAARKNMTPQMGHFGGDGEFVFLPLAISEDEVAETIRLTRGGAAPGGRRHALSGVLLRAGERLNRVTTPGDVIEAFEAYDYRFTLDPAGRERQWEAKRKRFEENAAMGDVLAMAGLHYCLSKGLGVEKDEARAYQLARLAFDSDEPAGRHIMGRCLYNGIGVKAKNELAGMALIRGAAEDRFPISQILVGQELLDAGDVAGAKAAWTKAAQDGVPSACVYLAQLALDVIPLGRSGANANVTEAIRALKPAVDAQYPWALYLLSTIYRWNVDPPNKEECVRYLVLAAKGGYARAQGVLARELGGAWMLKDDLPFELELPPNPADARRWAQLAADQDDGYGLLVMACLREAQGDFAGAVEACARAKKLQYLHANILESMWSLNGDVGRPKDLGAAFAAARRAADSDDPRALTWLAALYADGSVPEPEKGLAPDGRRTGIHHAIHLFLRASNAGRKSAHEAIDEFAKKVKADPDLGYWQLFQKVYPGEVKEVLGHAE